jgi:hypothetical protein
MAPASAGPIQSQPPCGRQSHACKIHLRKNRKSQKRLTALIFSPDNGLTLTRDEKTKLDKGAFIVAGYAAPR